MIRIYETGTVKDEEIFARSSEQKDVAPVVTEIIEKVRKNGDAALKAFSEKFDHAKLNNLEVSEKISDITIKDIQEISIEDYV